MGAIEGDDYVFEEVTSGYTKFDVDAFLANREEKEALPAPQPVPGYLWKARLFGFLITRRPELYRDRDRANRRA